MKISYQEEFERYKKGFDRESWRLHERNKAKLKSFARVKFARKAVCTDADLRGDKVFVKNYRFTAASQIYSNVEVVRNLRMINEFLISTLCKQIGLESAIYLAQIKSKKEPNYQEIQDVMKNVDMPNAIVSKNFLKADEEFCEVISYDFNSESGFSLKAFVDGLAQMKKDDPDLKVDLNDIKTKLFKLIILDLLTLQLDRHIGNIPIVLNTKENRLGFGAVFDNEYSFNVKALRDYDLEKDVFCILNEDGKIDVEKVIKAFDRRLAKYGDYIWTITPNCKTDYHSCMKDIVMQALLSPKAKRIVIEVVSNLNVEKAFDDMEKSGVKVGQGYKQFVSQIIGYGKAQLVKQMAKHAQTKFQPSGNPQKNKE